jgi:plastocyanin domain-containing protein
MLRKATFLGTLAGLGFLLGAISGVLAAEPNINTMTEHNAPQSNQFQRIEQPLGNKIAVTIGGLGLIGLELWWFLLSKPKSRQAVAKAGIQEVTVTVDGGYEPSQIVVQAGQPVRLNFHRKDPSSCLEEVRFPDFHIAQELPLNQVTTIEFTPDKPGRYEFTCGMNMFRGVVEVQAGDQTAMPIATVPETTHAVTPTNHHVEPTVSSASSLETTMTPDGIQEATVTVAKGYQSSY